MLLKQTMPITTQTHIFSERIMCARLKHLVSWTLLSTKHDNPSCATFLLHILFFLLIFRVFVEACAINFDVYKKKHSLTDTISLF